MKKNLIYLVIAGLVLSNLTLMCINSQLRQKRNRSESVNYELTDSYEKMTKRYYDTKDDCSRLENRLEDLDNQIYNIVEGKNFNVEIEHEGKTITYMRTGNFIKDLMKNYIW